MGDLSIERTLLVARKGGKNGVLALVLFCSFASIVWGTRGSSDVSAQTRTWLREGASRMPLSEPADAILILTKEWKWKRYLSAVLHLPDWLNLGLEHRTRFEHVTIHGDLQPGCRSNRFPDSTTVPRTVRPEREEFQVFVWFFEGHDSRGHFDDFDGYVTMDVTNEVDVLQRHGEKRVGDRSSCRPARWTAYDGFWPAPVVEQSK